MAAIETERQQVYGWIRKGPGEYVSPNGRWHAEGAQVTGDDGWWVRDGEQYADSFDTLRELKLWVAEQELREAEAEAFNAGVRYAVEHDQIEAGNGRIFRLRLRDNHQGNETVAEAFVREGKVALGSMRDLTPGAADALSAMLASAAALAEIEEEA